MHSYHVLLFPSIIISDFVILDVTDQCDSRNSQVAFTIDFVSVHGYSAPSVHLLEAQFPSSFFYSERK